MSDVFWLSERQFSRLAQLLPTDTRGKPRVDDRRVMSGIVLVLKPGGRWDGEPSVYGPCKTLCNRFVRWVAKGVWMDVFGVRRPASCRQRCRSLPRRRRRIAVPQGKRGERTQTIDRWRDGRTTKIHAFTGRFCRPPASLLTGCQAVGCTTAEALLDLLPPNGQFHGDNGDDTNAVRRKIEGTGTAPGMPPRIYRRWKPCFSFLLDRGRNAIERNVQPPKDFRRIATR